MAQTRMIRKNIHGLKMSVLYSYIMPIHVSPHIFELSGFVDVCVCVCVRARVCGFLMPFHVMSGNETQP